MRDVSSISAGSSPRLHIENRLSRLVSLLAEEERGKKREPVDGPIIGRWRYCRLQKDFYGHGILSIWRRLVGFRVTRSGTAFTASIFE